MPEADGQVLCGIATGGAEELLKYRLCAGGGLFIIEVMIDRGFDFFERAFDRPTSHFCMITLVFSGHHSGGLRIRVIFLDLDVTVIEGCMLAVGHDQFSEGNYEVVAHFSERFPELPFKEV